MAHIVTTQDLAATLAVEFGAAVEAVLGSVLKVSTASATPSGRGWGTPITASGALAGTITVHVDGDGVRAVARRMMGLEEDPEDSVAADMLRELWAQAASSTTRKDGLGGLSLVVGAAEAGALDATVGAWEIQAGGERLVTLAVAGTTTARADAAAAPAAGGSTPPAVEPGADQGNLAALLDIDLPLIVRFARTELTLRALTLLGPGSMVDMGRSPDDPVQLLVGTQVIAEGEVVVVAGNYGVRITSLVSPADRLRAMEL